MKLPWQKKEGADDLEVSLPDDIKAKLEGAASKEDVTVLKTTLEKLQESMALLSSNAAAEAEERRKAQAKKQAEESGQRQQQTEEELAELALTDPLAAMKRVVADQLGGRDTALLTINASNLKREIFEDQDKYPFYTGAIKEEVDKILSQQKLNAQNDRSVIEHAYHSVVGQHYKELTEGKLKTRFASAESDRGSQGKTGNQGTKEPRKLSEDEAKAARILGFKDDVYSKMLEEEGVGYV
jgi:hypothetical protein